MWREIVSLVLYACTGVGLICYKRINPTPLRALVIWFLVFTLVDVSLHLFYAYFPSTLLVKILYILLDPLHFIVYSYVFVLTQNPTKYLKNIVWSVAIGFVLFTLYQLFFRLHMISVATDSFLIKSILILVVILFYFWNLITAKGIIELSRNPLFWIATASLFYFTGNIIATGLFHYLIQDSEQWAKALYKLNYILEILVYLFSIYAFLIASKRKISP